MRAGVASVSSSTTIGCVRNGSMTEAGMLEIASPSWPDTRVCGDRRTVLPSAEAGELDSQARPLA